MRKVLFYIIFCFYTGFSFSQVINIESKRFLKDTNGFVGRVDFNFSAVKNVQEIMLLGNNAHLQYKRDQHRFLVISDLSFIKAAKQDFVNSGYFHARYNYRTNKILTWEVFVQAQYNRALLLNSRYISGSGPRFKLIKRSKIKAYTAALYLFEKQSQNFDSIQKTNHRLSSYLSVTLDFKRIDFSSTTFYQPNMQDFNDYRIANDTSFELELSKHFNFRTGLNLLFDTRQPVGVPELTYLLKNGLTFRF